MVLPHQSLEYLKDRDDESGRIRGCLKSPPPSQHRRFHQSRWIGLRPARLLIRAARRPIDSIARSRKESGTVAGFLDRAISKDAVRIDHRLDESKRLADEPFPENLPFASLVSVPGCVTSGSRNSVALDSPVSSPRHFAFGEALNHLEFATCLRIKRRGGSFRSEQLLKRIG